MADPRYAKRLAIVSTPEGAAATTTGDKLDDAFLAVVAPVIRRAWDRLRDPRDPDDQESAMMRCLGEDQEDLWWHTVGDEKLFKAAAFATAAIQRAIWVHGYGAVQEFLTQRIKLDQLPTRPR